MEKIKTFLKPLRQFWATPQQRQLVAWVLGALGLAVLVFGGYTYYDADREIDDLDEKADLIRSQYPTVERDGEDVVDLRDAPQTDLVLLAMYKRDTEKAETRHSRGMMYAGIGVVGLALAYLVWPEKREPAAPVDEPAEPGG